MKDLIILLPSYVLIGMLFNLVVRLEKRIDEIERK